MYSYNVNDQLTLAATDIDEQVISYSYVDPITGVHGTQLLLETRTVPDAQNPSSYIDYETVSSYNLQGRLSEVVKDEADQTSGIIQKTITYEYDSNGNRIATTVAQPGEDTVRTEFLTDTQNHTGYSQVLQKTEFDSSDEPIKKTVYSIGHDQILQTIYNYSNGNWDAGATDHFGTDGHGSVRVLYDAMFDVITATAERYYFDAYGNLLNFNTIPRTDYLYSGEAFDFGIGQQYLRARWYDATTGRFNRLDPFFGNHTDPQSFHKYGYVHGDPIAGIDPTGLFNSVSTTTATTGGATLQGGGFGSALAALRAAKSFQKIIHFVTRVRNLWAANQGRIKGAFALAEAIESVIEWLNFDYSEFKKIASQLTSIRRLVKNPSIKANVLTQAKIKFSLPVTKKLRFLGRLVMNNEIMGEVATALVMHFVGFETKQFHWKFSNNGPDFVQRHSASKLFAVTEAKGGSSRLSKKKTKYGYQMDHQWITYWLDEITNDRRNNAQYSKDLKRDFDNGKPIFAIVSRFTTSGKKFQMKLAAQVFYGGKRNSKLFFDWPRGF